MSTRWLSSTVALSRTILPVARPFFPMSTRFSSTDTTSSPTPPARSRPQKKRPISSAPGGTVLSNLAIHKGESDPVALDDSEYPEWLWSLLDAKPSKQEKESLEFMKKTGKKERREKIKLSNMLSKR
ncbi:hypothetical protein BT69DRAFT_1263369 [Atractiella rhizophila]|nr:hypothetical protein BT69DRAFT_1263369 [Atractiella rhizophila]